MAGSSDISYLTIKNGLISQLEAVANFSADNVKGVVGSVINAGHDRFMVVMFDSADRERNVYGMLQTVWKFQIVLGEKVRPDAAAAETRFATDLGAIITRLDQYPELGGVALNAALTHAEDLVESLQIGGQEYNQYGLIVEATEIVSANYQE